MRTLLPERHQVRVRGHNCNALTFDLIHVVLALLHAIDLLLEDEDSQRHALAKLLILFLIIILVRGNLGRHHVALVQNYWMAYSVIGAHMQNNKTLEDPSS